MGFYLREPNAGRLLGERQRKLARAVQRWPTLAVVWVTGWMETGIREATSVVIE